MHVKAHQIFKVTWIHNMHHIQIDVDLFSTVGPCDRLTASPACSGQTPGIQKGLSYLEKWIHTHAGTQNISFFQNYLPNAVKQNKEF